MCENTKQGGLVFNRTTTKLFCFTPFPACCLQELNSPAHPQTNWNSFDKCLVLNRFEIEEGCCEARHLKYANKNLTGSLKSSFMSQSPRLVCNVNMLTRLTSCFFSEFRLWLCWRFPLRICVPEGYSSEFLVGVAPGSPNPDPISDQNIPFSTPVFRPGL